MNEIGVQTDISPSAPPISYNELYPQLPEQNDIEEFRKLLYDKREIVIKILSDVDRPIKRLNIPLRDYENGLYNILVYKDGEYFIIGEFFMFNKMIHYDYIRKTNGFKNVKIKIEKEKLIITFKTKNEIYQKEVNVRISKI